MIVKSAIKGHNFWLLVNSKIPKVNKEAFWQETYLVNLYRIQLFFTILVVLLLVLVTYEMVYLERPFVLNRIFLARTGFIVGCLSFCVIIGPAKHRQLRNGKRNNPWIVNAAALFSLLIAAGQPIVYPYGVEGAYLAGCFFVANVFFLAPRISLSLYLLSYVTFLLALFHSQIEPHLLPARYFYGTTTVIIACFTSIVLFNTRVRDFNNRMAIELLSYQDSLTKIANRRHFDLTLERERKLALRENHPLSILLLDVDFFKDYNDLFGHPRGDECLRRVAAIIEDALVRPADFVARYGGEEFAVILPNTDQQGAFNVADKLRTEVEKSKIPHPGSRISSSLTISVGVYCVGLDCHSSPEALLAAADKALYRAKQEGRNRVVSLDGGC